MNKRRREGLGFRADDLDLSNSAWSVAGIRASLPLASSALSFSDTRKIGMSH